MRSTAPYSTVNIPEVITRNSTARDIVAGFSAAMPALSAIWEHIGHALADAGDLAAEVVQLSVDLKAVRLDRANARAAMLATLAADADGEADPLSYLRDELGTPQNGPAARGGDNRG
jgi:CelD/BcsL family acetyltransferase involved in cellulose biosynthesis